MLMYGTTHVRGRGRGRACAPYPTLWGTTGLFPGTSTLAAGLATSGALTGWLREIAGGRPFEQLLAEAAADAARARTA